MGQANMLDADDIAIHLSSGTRLLRGQYKIERKIGQGGFGITYLARDSLNRRVVIKECFPANFCIRKGNVVHTNSEQEAEHFAALLKQFKAEARRVAALDHPGIVGVHQVFAENQTGYLAMELLDGIDLMTLAESDPGRLTSEVVRNVLDQVLDAVRYMHDQGILHRDIAPDNLILGDGNEVTLIDFGAADASFEKQKIPDPKIIAVKDGFSPYEFYVRNRSQTLSSDLFSLGATFYFLISGEAPPDSQSRMEAVSLGQPDPYVPLLHAGWDHDPRILQAIDLSLSLDEGARLQSAEDWLGCLSGPMPPKKVVFDPNLSEKISVLVQNTNSKLIATGNVVPGGSDVSVTFSEDKPAKPQGPRQFVDIFGNPIRDVEAFLREQDILCRERAARVVKEQIAEPVPKRAEKLDAVIRDDSEEPIVPVSLLGKMFARFRLTKSSTDPNLFQT